MSAETHSFEPGEVLFREGDNSNGLYLIQEGEVEIFRSRENAEVLLTTLRAGDVIGTMTMISRAPRTASARAKGRCLVAYYQNDKLKEGFKNIPIWAQAVIKDTISRIKEIDEKLMEATIRERTLQRSVGTVYHHSSQLAYLLASYIRKTSIMDDTRTPLYPTKDFLINAEFILLKKFIYLEKIFSIFEQNGLFKLTANQKYGKVIMNPNAEILEDYASFAISVVKKGTNYFAPPKLYKWMSALIRISKKFNNVEQFSKEQLSGFLKADLGRDDIDMILSSLAQHGIIKETETSIQFSPAKLQKTIIFESVVRALKEVNL